MNKLTKILIGLGLIVAFGLGFAAYHTSSPTLGAGTYQIPTYAYSLDATTATTTYAAFPGTLHTLVIGTAVVGDVITVYDSASSTTASTVIAKVTTTSTVPLFLEFDTSFVNGLTIQQSATSTLTASWQQQ